MDKKTLACRFNTVTMFRLTCLFFALMPWCSLSAAERLYVNDKKAPENRKDLDVLQAALVKSLP